jgi:hypothetical protein
MATPTNQGNEMTKRRHPRTTTHQRSLNDSPLNELQTNLGSNQGRDWIDKSGLTAVVNINWVRQLAECTKEDEKPKWPKQTAKWVGNPLER